MQKGSFTCFAICLSAASPSPAAAQEPVELAGPWNVTADLSESDTTSEEGSYYDEYQFSLRAGQRVLVAARAEDLDGILTIYQAGDAKQIIATDDDSGGGLDPQLTFTVPSAGVYVVRLASFGAGETGEYQLQVEPLAALPAPVTQPTRTDTMSVSSLIFEGALATTDPESGGRYFDDYGISLAPGEEVLIRVSSREFDPMVAMLRADDRSGVPMVTDDDSGDGDNPLILFSTPSAGNFIVRVTAFSDGETGSYELRINQVR